MMMMVDFKDFWILLFILLWVDYRWRCKVDRREFEFVDVVSDASFIVSRFVALRLGYTKFCIVIELFDQEKLLLR